MKKLTIRLDDYVYDRLFLVSKEENTSINKIVSLILRKEIDKPKELNVIEEMINHLTEIENKLIRISKKQHLHFNVSLQHFVNHGYFQNADPKEDKCYLELQKNSKDYFNE